MKIPSIKLRNAVAALSAVLLIGGIISEVAIASLISSYLVSQEGLGARISQEALLASRSGVEDAMLRITRYGDTAVYRDYWLSVGSLNTHIIVTKDTHPSYSKFTITATTSVLNKERKVQAIVIVNTVTGASQIESIDNIT